MFSSMLPVYEALLASTPAPRILVYSGDVDGCIPHTGTRRWVAALGMPRAQKRRSWHSGTGERVRNSVNSDISL